MWPELAGWFEQGPAQVLEQRQPWQARSSTAQTTVRQLVSPGSRVMTLVRRVSQKVHSINPYEQVRSHLKRSPANLAKRNLAQLTALAKTRLRRMQYRPGLLDDFFASTRLDLTPF